MPQHTPPQDSPQEVTRRVENLARLGTVVAVRHAAPARCRVKLGDNTTDWLPWLAGRAAGQQGSSWWPPVVGEQCLVIAPGGDLGQGLVLLGVYSNAMAQPANRAGVDRTQWSPRDWAEYSQGRRTVHLDQALRLEVGSQCSADMRPDSITLQVGGDCRITMAGGAITLNAGGAALTIGGGRVTSTVDVIAGSISLQRHVHGGVRSGSDLSGVPR